MTFTTAHVSVSLDGYVAGPGQSLDDPIGRGGMGLHAWHLDLSDRPGAEVDRRWNDRLLRPRGAYVMGRNMFGPVRGPWCSWATRPGAPPEARDEDWTGWWGDEPTYHAPVFVLTHHERDPLELTGTTFHFVTGGLAEALRRARAAGDGDVDIAGGASAVRQALAAGEVDELTLDIAPVLLGDGERLLVDLPDLTLEAVEAEHSPLATHVRYRVGSRATAAT